MRVGEWKVVDTTSFNKEDCTYYDNTTRSQCEDYGPCELDRTSGCVKVNGNIDCTTVYGGYDIHQRGDVCSAAHQVIQQPALIS